jgi:hypothetical protein
VLIVRLRPSPAWQLVMIGLVGRINPAMQPMRSNIHWRNPELRAVRRLGGQLARMDRVLGEMSWNFTCAPKRERMRCPA